jgi:hypothetical protein
MTIVAAVQAFFDTLAGQAVLLVSIVAVADFLFGIMAAFRDDTFQASAVAAWLRKHLAGRVGPIFLTLFLGYAAGGASLADGLGGMLSPGSILTGVGALAAVAYVTEVIASIRSSIQPPTIPTADGATVKRPQPVPVD